MKITEYRGRRAVGLENERVRVTLTLEGGHVAEILHKPTNINPLWTPPWPSIEPSSYRPELHPKYGEGAEAKLLAGIMGHNLCLDLFGGPSEQEAAAGITVHGEASIALYDAEIEGDALIMRAALPKAQLSFERRVQLNDDSVHFTECVENTGAFDRPIAWTQHVTLGDPFIARGRTKFDLTATRSKTYESEFGDLYIAGTEFDWPLAPGRNGEKIDLRAYHDLVESAGFTAHLMDPQREYASFGAYSPVSRVMFGYQWRREDFPWCGIWEENRSRQQMPWNGETVARGFEFGVSPMPETRRAMIDRGSLFGVPGFRWAPAKTRVTAAYQARITQSSSGNFSELFT
jgi:hypothetical protein